MPALTEKNLTIPRNVKDIPIEKGVEAGKSPEVDGYNLGKTVQEYTSLNKVIPYDTDGEKRVNTLEIRERGIDQNESTLEGKVNKVLGGRLKVDNDELASKVIVQLFAEGVQAEGHKFHSDDPITKEVRKYLSGTDDKVKKFKDLSVLSKERIGEFYTRAGINNIFDEHYFARVTSAGIDPADGRNYYGGVKINWG